MARTLITRATVVVDPSDPHAPVLEGHTVVVDGDTIQAIVPSGGRFGR
ncbi:MAG: hypothetical protein Q9O62_15405 [Ardenticatenia bacterium]|nr:hypothetical protein [Ardenticatenia bacterium]